MKIKEGFIIKKLGTGYVVVTVGQASKDFNGMIRLNPAGEFLWKSIQDGKGSKDKLVEAMLDRYDDLDEVTARADLDEFLESVKIALED